MLKVCSQKLIHNTNSVLFKLLIISFIYEVNTRFRSQKKLKTACMLQINCLSFNLIFKKKSFLCIKLKIKFTSVISSTHNV